ncbi:aminoglycoside adenylyltransferase domain-containing protein [Sporosarcina sp. D27]|uniref:aminoglycoside adenylyltransferase domain-containing protein n=1 Tax=Sporosarcina sp. D27 TaxID=1382305 RepID=UPI00046F8AA1|nr:aminoglycoside adenylyltransferase domain-containing protein [Sporosarcina sp. D27]
MGYDWETCPHEVKVFIYNLEKGIQRIIKDDFVGFYIHGSLAMGGFNPNSSDIDVLVVTNKAIGVEIKWLLAQFFLHYSNCPFPVEISFLNKEQLKEWKHPCPFDFHYSEFWRKRYQDDLISTTFQFSQNDNNTDTDLAAHITITNHRGICVSGDSIARVFPIVPKSDYITSIMGDFQDCVRNIEDEPVYCCLNLIRVFWYLKEGVISSKQDAGDWGLKILPQDLRITVEKAINIYTDKKNNNSFDKEELHFFKNYIAEKVDSLLQTRA